MNLRIRLARLLCPASHRVVPFEPTKDMCKAAAMAMSPAHRPTEEWVSVQRKHAIRYQAMVSADSGTFPKRVRKKTYDGAFPWSRQPETQAHPGGLAGGPEGPNAENANENNA